MREFEATQPTLTSILLYFMVPQRMKRILPVLCVLPLLLLGGCVTTATYTPEPIKVTRGTQLFGRENIEALSRAILNSKTATDGSRQVQNRLEFKEIILTWVNY